MNRILKIVFTLSVILNVVLVTAAGGFFWRMAQHMPQRDPVLMKELSPESRKAMARTFRERRKDMRKHFRQIRESRAALMDVMSAETFDPAAYDKAVGALLTERELVMRDFAQAVKSVAQDLSPEEREKLGQRLIYMGQPGGHHRKPPSHSGASGHSSVPEEAGPSFRR